MADADRDTLMRMAAFEHVRRLGEVHDHLSTTELKPGFVFQGARIPLINPQRGIFKPQQMCFLLSIKTVFPKPGGKVWYDDQREVHRQIFEGDETIDYAFMGKDPDAADNRYPPVRRTNQNRLIGPSIVPNPQFSAAWKPQWHNAGLIKLANFQNAIFRRELDG
jgi:putative restriction endonuclease